MTTTAPRTTATGQLGNGELRRQVAAYLDENPGSRTPGTIARALDRSAGAVGNALKTLAERGRPSPYPASPPGTRPPRHQGSGRRHIHRAGARPPPRRSPPPPRRPRPAGQPGPAPSG